MALRYFLACLVVTSALESGQPEEKYSLVGQQLHLNPAVPKHPVYILWKHNGNKVVEFDGKEQTVFGRYHDRITLDWVSAEIDITNLQEEDRGLYELESDLSSQMYFYKFQLTVIGKVAKPTIFCTLNSSGSDTQRAQAILTCTAEPTQPRSSITYEWESSGNVVHGPELKISLEDKHNDEMHICRVKNPLSSEAITFAAKDCHSGSDYLMPLLISLVVILVIAVVVFSIFYCKTTGKACFGKGSRADVEKRAPGGEMGEVVEKEPLLDRAPTFLSNQKLSGLAPADTEEDSDQHEETPQAGHVRRTAERINRKSLTQKSNNGSSTKKSKLSTPSSHQSHPGRKPSLTDIKPNLSGDHRRDTDGDQVTEPSDADEGNMSDPTTRLDFNEESPASQQPSSGSMNKRALIPPPTLRKPSSPSQDENNLSTVHKGDTDEDSATEPPDTGESNVPGQLDFDEHPDEESVFVLLPKSENKEDEKEDTTPTKDVSSPALRPLTKPSPDERREDAAGEDKDENVRESLSPGSEKGPEPGWSPKKTPPAPPPRPRKTPSSSQDEHNLSGKQKGDGDGDQVTEPSDCGGSNVPDPTLESSPVAAQPNSEKEEDVGVEAKSPPASTPSSPQTHSNKDADDRESPSPDPETGAEKDESYEEEQPSLTTELSKSPSGELDSSTSQEETHLGDDTQAQMDKTASGGNCESDGDEADEDLYSSSPQSSTLNVKSTDNSKTDELEESPNAASAQEVESESDESKGQLDNDTAEEDKPQSKTDEKHKDASDSEKDF